MVEIVPAEQGCCYSLKYAVMQNSCILSEIEPKLEEELHILKYMRLYYSP